MNRNPNLHARNSTYIAPKVYVVVFYMMLIGWTIFSVALLGIKGWTNWTQIFMIGFIFVITWYFSLGIAYRIDMEKEGNIQLTSIRRIIKTHPQRMALIEGPHFPVGFVRFRLEREKAYLFCVVKHKSLQQILAMILEANPDTKFKNL